MPQAMGVIEIRGIPAALVAADIMTKAADIQVVGLENADAARISVVIRGDTGAVQTAIAAALAQLKQQPNVQVWGYHLLPCPDTATDAVLLYRRSPTPVEDTLSWLDD